MILKFYINVKFNSSELRYHCAVTSPPDPDIRSLLSGGTCHLLRFSTEEHTVEVVYLILLIGEHVLVQ